MPYRMRFCPSYNVVPEMALEYAKGMGGITELSRDEIIRSKPFKNFLRKFREVRL